MQMQLMLRFKTDTVESATHVQNALLSVLSDYGVEVIGSGKLDHVTEEVVVYTDGGCDARRGGIGAWAFVVQKQDGSIEEFCEVVTETTNNRMELTALIKALEHIEIGPPVRVFADSEYVIKGLTVWSRNWVRNGWKTATGNPVINQDLWEHALMLYKLHSVKFEWVKGHTGIELNERCDALCTDAMTEAHKALLRQASAQAI